MLAWLVVAKFARHLPVYRHQEMLLGPLKLWLSRTFCADCCGEQPERCGLWNGGSSSTSCKTTCCRSTKHTHDSWGSSWQGGLGISFRLRGRRSASIRLLRLQPYRSREGPEKILANYTGYLQTDGYTVYTGLVRDSQGDCAMRPVLRHARRKFDEARYTTSHPLMHEASAWIQQLYDVEDPRPN